ncbi:MAG: glycosyltransferase family 4 protein [Gammaproteobacteria bacterium]|nr:glycosyltransferase family 4 protein [Gammaproteobacteria bacterium]MBU1647679.1 glycosyltransferase family 4 protein [Gammaproteobacteria bacterium]MBU1971825.1 glycosyltransferase family 4 protein [Gammaproteobacteria bacterium]
MKLAVVRQKYTPFGGAERFVDRALGALAGHGTEVTLLCREWDGGEARFPVEIVDPPYSRLGGRKARDAGFARAIQDIIAARRFDLVQSHERIPGCHIYRAGDGVHASWLELRDATRGGAARFVTALSAWHRYTLAAEAAMFRHPDLRAVICNSRMVKDDIARRFGVPDEKLRLIYNGVDTAHFHPGLREAHRGALREKLGCSGTVKVVLFVGSGFERKGVATLLDALARLPHAQLWVVGRDKAQAAMERRATRLGIASRVRFFGPQPDVRPFYGTADVMALPTLYDPFPNAALEAMACGLPLVTTTTCGAAELVREGENGAVCAPTDADALAACLDLLLRDGPTQQRRAAARAAAEPLTLDATAGSLLDLYRDLLGPAPQAAAAAQL